MKVLIIDEDSRIADSLYNQEVDLDIKLLYSHSPSDGLSLCQEAGGEVEIVMMRDVIAGHASCSSIQEFMSTRLIPDIVIYTEIGDPTHVDLALENGAWDYIVAEKPEEVLPDVLRRVLRFRRNRNYDLKELHQEVVQHQEDHGIIGSSQAIQSCVNLISRISHADASVLITGETGTGKELFASAIHNISSRSHKNMTVVDCAALPTTLVESILFGHIKGSFTGADKRQEGLIKKAHMGSLFLDEVGEMPLEIQKKFLRVLQEREYLPVGSRVTEFSDFRLIAATNKDLDQMVEEGSFREDLLYRLKTFQLQLPPLKSRRTDIAELAYHFRNILCKRNKVKTKKLSTDYLVTLTSYDWPGNVRELFQAVEYSFTYAFDSIILEPAHLPLHLRQSVTKKKLAKHRQYEEQTHDIVYDDLASMPSMREDRERAIQNQEKQYLQKLLLLSGGDIQICCDTAALSRSRLYDLLKKYGLSKNTVTLHSS